MREQLLNDLGEGLVDGVIVYRSEIEAETDVERCVIEELPHVIPDLIETVDLLLIREEDIRVNLVNEDLVRNVLVDSTASLNDVAKAHAVRFVVLGLGIYYIDE